MEVDVNDELGVGLAICAILNQRTIRLVTSDALCQNRERWRPDRKDAMTATTQSFLSPAKAGSGLNDGVIPGLRSLGSLTRGYHLSPLRGSLMRKA